MTGLLLLFRESLREWEPSNSDVSGARNRFMLQ